MASLEAGGRRQLWACGERPGQRLPHVRWCLELVPSPWGRSRPPSRGEAQTSARFQRGPGVFGAPRRWRPCPEHSALRLGRQRAGGNAEATGSMACPCKGGGPCSRNLSSAHKGLGGPEPGSCPLPPFPASPCSLGQQTITGEGGAHPWPIFLGPEWEVGAPCTPFPELSEQPCQGPRYSSALPSACPWRALRQRPPNWA